GLPAWRAISLAMVKTSQGPTKSSSSASSKIRMPIFSVIERPDVRIPAHHIRAKAVRPKRASERLCHAHPAALHEGVGETDEQRQHEETQRDLVERVEHTCPMRPDQMLEIAGG